MGSDNLAQLDDESTFNGEYRVVGCLSTGGMGAIYEVIHLRTKRRRALKVMLRGAMSSAEMRARFELEATVVSAVESPHIAEVIDAGLDEATGCPFIVMELLRGENLSDLLAREGTVPPADVVTYLSHAAFALEKTHAEGIVHRDLKPDNLFLTHLDDGTPCVKLLDFGIAKVLDEDRTQHTRGILGTPLYISPEQVHGRDKISPQTDVYALAHIGYTLLTGEPYWRTEERQAESIMPLLVRVMGGKTEPASRRALRETGTALPEGFDDWFDQATALVPADRHPGPLAMVEALAETLQVPFATNPELTVRPVRTSSTAPPSIEEPCLADALPPVRGEGETEARATVAATPLALALRGPSHVPPSTVTAAPLSRYIAAPQRSARWPAVALAALVAGGVVYVATRSSGDTLPVSAASVTLRPAVGTPATTLEPSDVAPAVSAPPTVSAPPAVSAPPVVATARSTSTPPRLPYVPRRDPRPLPPAAATAQWSPPVLDR